MFMHRFEENGDIARLHDYENAGNTSFCNDDFLLGAVAYGVSDDVIISTIAFKEPAKGKIVRLPSRGKVLFIMFLRRFKKVLAQKVL